MPLSRHLSTAARSSAVAVSVSTKPFVSGSSILCTLAASFDVSLRPTFALIFFFDFFHPHIIRRIDRTHFPDLQLHERQRRTGSAD